jgi:hypothetical protein
MSESLEQAQNPMQPDIRFRAFYIRETMKWHEMGHNPFVTAESTRA